MTETDKDKIKTLTKLLGLEGKINSNIGKKDSGWYKDFLLGIKCGIAAQKVVRR